MDKEFIVNSNKLIAEFMEFEYNEIDYIKKDMIKYGSSSIYTKKESYKYHIPTAFKGFINSYGGYMDFSNNSKKENCYNYYVEHMSFDTSYDWLMPVVEKIENLMTTWSKPNYKNGYTYWMDRFRFAFWDIKCLYEYVVEFIKWYNENNKK